MSQDVIEPSKTAMYRYCQAVVDELNAWKEHEDTYTDQMKALHAQVISDLSLKIEQKGTLLKVSYQLKKE